METSDWYRNTKWNPEVEATFFERLSRAQDKAQYLKIQASVLAKTHPKATLALVAKFFELKKEFFMADAFVASANAHLALGQIDEAVIAYQKALEREVVFPNYKTTAWSEFALLVADRRLRSHFDEALTILGRNRTELIFPSQVFAWHGAYALIQAEQGNRTSAKDHAVQALDASSMKRSGLSRRPNVGLVGSEFPSITKRLQKLVQERF